MSKRLTSLAAVLAVVMFSVAAVQAEDLDYYWAGGNTSMFTTGNWKVDSPSGETATVALTASGYNFDLYVDNSNGQTLEFDNSNFASIRTLNIGTAAGETTAAVQRTSGQNFVIANGKTLNIYTGGSFTYNYTQQFQNNADINIDGGTFTIEAANSLRVGNGDTGTITISNDGQLIVKTTTHIGVVANNGEEINKIGKIVQNGGTATFSNTLDLGWGDKARGEYVLSNGTLITTADAGLWNGSITAGGKTVASSFTVNGGTANFQKEDVSFIVGMYQNLNACYVDNVFTLDTGTVNATGEFLVQYNGKLEINNGYFNAGSVVVDTTTSGSISMAGGTLTTSAIDMKGETFSQAGGTLTPKTEVGMTIAGNYTMDAAATLKPNGTVTVEGDADLSGTVDLSAYANRIASVGDTFTLVSANSISNVTASKITNTPNGWINTLSPTSLKTSYEDGQGDFYWSAANATNNKFYTGYNWSYNDEVSGDMLLAGDISGRTHVVSDFTRNCFIYETDNDVWIDWSDLGVGSLTVGEGAGTIRSATVYRDSALELKTSMTVNEGGTANLNTLKLFDNANFTVNGGNVNIGSGGIVTSNEDDTYTINLSGGTFGTNGASWSSALDATIADGATVTFAPEDGETIEWAGALNGENGTVNVAGDGAFKLVGIVAGDVYVEDSAELIGEGSVLGDLTLDGNMNINLDELDTLFTVNGAVAGDGKIQFFADDFMDYLDQQVPFLTSAGSSLGDISSLYSFPEIAEEYMWTYGQDGNMFWVGVAAAGGEGVPEPSTWALLIIGAAGLLYWRKRKNA